MWGHLIPRTEDKTVKTLNKLILLFAVATFAMLSASTAQAEMQWQKYSNIADVKFIMEYAAIPQA